MSIFNLLTFGVKTAANIYQTRRETQQLEAKAEKESLKTSAKAKLIAGEALTEDEANTIVL